MAIDNNNDCKDGVGAVAKDDCLCRWFESHCHAATRKGHGIIVAIDRGKDIGDINMMLEREAARDANRDCCFYADELNNLLPSGDVVGEHGGLPKDDPKNNDPWVWALRTGYARERVLSYAMCKAAMLNTHDVGCSPEQREELFNVYPRQVAHLYQLEHEVINKSTTEMREPPSKLMRARRSLWKNSANKHADVLRYQPAFSDRGVMLGYTGRVVEAFASDPLLEREDTAAELAYMYSCTDERDSMLGTETFVSFVFPTAEHEWMQAVGVNGPEMSGVRVGERRHTFPAMVTMHNPKGALRAFMEPPEGAEHPPNVFFASDAVPLMCAIHSLCMNKDGDKARPDYLFMEHELLHRA